MSTKNKIKTPLRVKGGENSEFSNVNAARPSTIQLLLTLYHKDIDELVTMDKDSFV